MKNWTVTHGENYVSLNHTYSGRPTALTPGSVYSIMLPTEAVEALIAELAWHLQAMQEQAR